MLSFLSSRQIFRTKSAGKKYVMDTALDINYTILDYERVACQLTVPPDTSITSSTPDTFCNPR
jgi:hypothetical protein